MAEKAESRYKSKVLIHNNILYTNGSGAIWMENALGIDLINNSFYRNSENHICKHPEIQLIGSEYINVLNNIIYSSEGKSGISTLVSREILIKIICNTIVSTVNMEMGPLKQIQCLSLLNQEMINSIFV